MWFVKTVTKSLFYAKQNILVHQCIPVIKIVILLVGAGLRHGKSSLSLTLQLRCVIHSEAYIHFEMTLSKAVRIDSFDLS